MALTLAAVLLLSQQCAPQVAPETMLSVARVESGFDPLIIGVNGRPHQTLRPASKAEAIRQAQALLAAGRNIDVGIAQINGRNLPRLGLSLADAFEPCANLAAEARILTENYRAAARTNPSPQSALRVAISAYNTGSPVRGFTNGYVGKVVAAAGHVVPAIQVSPAAAAERPDPLPAPTPVQLKAVRPSVPSSPPLDVFARPSLSVWAAAAPRPPPSTSTRSGEPS